ncbi:MAG: hypothetical protein HYZ31_12075, partial [Gammaproteobacteria bacterium]|nr:hypothetical protein [Gammaproteobacteria bacterium]
MRIKTTLGITTFALLPFLIASCGSDGPATGVYTINATGGLGGSNGGTGGDGDYLNAYKEAGLGNVEMLRAGSANASFTSTTPATSLGDNAVAITANTTIGVETIEPATGTPYLIANTTT